MWTSRRQAAELLAAPAMAGVEVEPDESLDDVAPAVAHVAPDPDPSHAPQVDRDELFEFWEVPGHEPPLRESVR